MHCPIKPSSFPEFPAGVTLTLPSRVLALEGLVSYPTNKALPFPIQGHIELHPDKTKPQHKAAARFLVDVQGSGKSHTANAELGFSHPKLGRVSRAEIILTLKV